MQTSQSGKQTLATQIDWLSSGRNIPARMRSVADLACPNLIAKVFIASSHHYLAASLGFALRPRRSSEVSKRQKFGNLSCHSHVVALARDDHRPSHRLSQILPGLAHRK